MPFTKTPPPRRGRNSKVGAMIERPITFDYRCHCERSSWSIHIKKKRAMSKVVKRIYYSRRVFIAS